MITVILLGLLIVGLVAFFLKKSGKIEDKNNNNIPDVIEETVKDVKETIAVVEKVSKKVKKTPTVKKSEVKKSEVKMTTEKKPAKKTATTKKK